MSDEDRLGGSEEGAPFNMALSTLKRISFLRDEQILARKISDVNMWQTSLHSMHAEYRGACELKPDEKGLQLKYQKQFDDLAAEHKEATCYKKETRLGAVKKVQTCGHQIDFHRVCHEYETDLMDVGQAHHLFMPSSKDPSVAFRGGR